MTTLIEQAKINDEFHKVFTEGNFTDITNFLDKNKQHITSYQMTQILYDYIIKNQYPDRFALLLDYNIPFDETHMLIHAINSGGREIFITHLITKNKIRYNKCLNYAEKHGEHKAAQRITTMIVKIKIFGK